MGTATSSAAHLDKTIFDVKMTSKSLERMSRKASKKQRENEKKVADALRGGDMERAKIYAETAVRQKKESLNHLRMASRLDAVVARMESAQMMNRVTPLMSRVSNDLDVVLKKADAEGLASVMDQFEEVCNNLDVTTATMEGSLDTATASAIPEDQVTSLLQQVAEAAGLEVSMELEAKGSVPVGAPAGTARTTPATATTAGAGRAAVSVAR